MKIKFIVYFLITILMISSVFAEVDPIEEEPVQIIFGDHSFSYFSWVFDQDQRYYLFQDGNHFLDVPGDDSFPKTFGKTFYNDARTFSSKGYSFVNMEKTKFYEGITKFESYNKLYFNSNTHSATHFRTYIYVSDDTNVDFVAKHDDGLKVYVWKCGDGIFNSENCERGTQYDEVFAKKTDTSGMNMNLGLEKGWNVIDFRHFNDYGPSYLYLNKDFKSAFDNSLIFMSSSEPTNTQLCLLGLVDNCDPTPQPDPDPIPPIPPIPHPIPTPVPNPIIIKPIDPDPVPPEPDPTFGKPVCSNIGSSSEGWYYQGKIIKYETCHCRPICMYEDSKSEGYYNSCNNNLIIAGDCSKSNGENSTPIPQPIPQPKPNIVEEKIRVDDVTTTVNVENSDVISTSINPNQNSVSTINLNDVKQSMIDSNEFVDVEMVEVGKLNGEESVIVRGTVNKGFWIFKRQVPKTMILTKDNLTSLR